MLRGERESAAVRIRVRHADGHWLTLEAHSRPLAAPDGLLVVSRDVTNQAKLEEDLRMAKLAAEQANEAKSEYLSRMSHELRTPLNAILGFAQLLDLDDLGDEQRDNLGHIMSGARHLLSLINEVLDIAAIEAGRLSLSLEPVALADVAAETVSLIRPLADTHHVVLAGPNVTCSTHVLGDRQRLKQVLLNLLSNAVTYNRDGGSVHLDCEPVPGGRLRIKVTDTGLGIPRRGHRAALRPLRAGGQPAQRHRGHRAGPAALQAPGRGHGRPPGAVDHCRQGQHLLGRAPPGRAPSPAGRAPAPGGAGHGRRAGPTGRARPHRPLHRGQPP